MENVSNTDGLFLEHCDQGLALPVSTPPRPPPLATICAYHSAIFETFKPQSALVEGHLVQRLPLIPLPGLPARLSHTYQVGTASARGCTCDRFPNPNVIAFNSDVDAII